MTQTQTIQWLVDWAAMLAWEAFSLAMLFSPVLLRVKPSSCNKEAQQ